MSQRPPEMVSEPLQIHPALPLVAVLWGLVGAAVVLSTAVVIVLYWLWR